MSDQHAACRETEQKLREANRRLQAEGPALERDKLVKALRAQIDSNLAAMDKLVLEARAGEKRAVDRLQAVRVELHAALTVLRYWQPAVLSWAQRCPVEPVPECVAAWAIVAPLLEQRR